MRQYKSTNAAIIDHVAQRSGRSGRSRRSAASRRSGKSGKSGKGGKGRRRNRRSRVMPLDMDNTAYLIMREEVRWPSVTAVSPAVTSECLHVCIMSLGSWMPSLASAT